MPVFKRPISLIRYWKKGFWKLDRGEHVMIQRFKDNITPHSLPVNYISYLTWKSLSCFISTDAFWHSVCFKLSKESMIVLYLIHERHNYDCPICRHKRSPCHSWWYTFSEYSQVNSLRLLLAFCSWQYLSSRASFHLCFLSLHVNKMDTTYGT